MRCTFENKIALVAGAAGGMGRQIALDLLDAGACVVGADMQAEPDQFRGRCGKWSYVQGDLATAAAVKRAVESAANRFGGLDVVANTVGVLWFDRDKTLIEIEEDVWDRVLAINLKPMVWLARFAVPEMRKRGGGAFVHFSSVDGTGGDLVPQDAYGASKAAMLRLSKSIAIQFAKDKIRSNAILPGNVSTPMQNRWRDNPAALSALEKCIPLGRVGTATDMSNVALFLLSDQASYVTGADFVVDGGATAGV